MIGLLDLIASPLRSPSRILARREAVEAVRTALSSLPHHYRRALGLVYVQGHTAADAAAEMGNTERAVHGLCRRGLKMLQQQMGSASAFLSSSG
jgi:RNA polymerase sigma-70 factor (ECF subfamily)